MSGRSIRQKTGGRSDRYEERRAQRGVTTTNAPTWQDGAARAAYSALASRCAASKKSKVAVMRQLLGSQTELEMFMLRVRASEADEENIREVLEFHRKKVESLGPEEARKACEMAKRTLVARGGMGGFGELRVISTSVPPSASIKSFLSSIKSFLSSSEELKKERLRFLGRATRPGRNLSAWSTDWMDPDVRVRPSTIPHAGDGLFVGDVFIEKDCLIGDFKDGSQCMTRAQFFSKYPDGKGTHVALILGQYFDGTDSVWGKMNRAQTGKHNNVRLQQDGGLRTSRPVSPFSELFLSYGNSYRIV